jgi:hypothetical protein
MSREGSHSFYKAAKGGLVDGHGVATIRYKSKLHHIGMGRALKGTRIILLVAGRHIRIITTEGRLLREFELDLNRDYQPQAMA